MQKIMSVLTYMNLLPKTILAVVDKHAPNETISNSMRKILMKPWITTGILKSIKTKQIMCKTHFLSGSP